MIGTIAVILVFGGLIFFHELGHFLVARSFGMGVKTFSLGFGPALYTKRRGKTDYQIAAFPLGGFVSLVGESQDAEIPDGFTEEESFALRPAWQRFLVIAAGATFNLILAWLICWGVMWANGKSHIPPVIGEILPGSAAMHSPLQEGDRILSIDGTSIHRFAQMPPLVQRSEGKAITIVAERDIETTITFTIEPTKLSHTLEDGRSVEAWSLGIRAKGVEHEEYGFFGAAVQGITEAKNMVEYTWQALVDLISRKVAFDNVGGPILIAQAIYKQADHGLPSILMIAALISVNLGVLNLLPIPVLDGGHLLFLLVEMGGRKPVPPAIQEKAMFFGLFLLISLMLAATFNDVMRFFS